MILRNIWNTVIPKIVRLTVDFDPGLATNKKYEEVQEDIKNEAINNLQNLDKVLGTDCEISRNIREREAQIMKRLESRGL